MTESESVALPLGDAALLTNAPHYSRFPRACQELLKKITEFSVNYRNYHHLQEWVVAEMQEQCAGAWTANDHTAKALNHKQQYIMETAKSQCILPIWAGSRSAFSRKLLLCAADCAIFLLSVAVAESVFLYRTESRNALLAVITFAVLLCFRPRRRRAEGKELNSRTDIWEPAFRLAFRIARREKPP